MKEILLTQGFTAIVDDEDYEHLSQYKWFAKKTTREGLVYAIRSIWINGSSRHMQMGRHLLNCDKGEIAEHRDGNGLNNQRLNLRKCTQAQNVKNASPYSKQMASPFKGVSWDNNKKRWRAEIHCDKKRYKLGRFKTDVEAALAYNEAAIKHHGEFARLNVFPKNI